MVASENQYRRALRDERKRLLPVMEEDLVSAQQRAREIREREQTMRFDPNRPERRSSRVDEELIEASRVTQEAENYARNLEARQREARRRLAEIDGQLNGDDLAQDAIRERQRVGDQYGEEERKVERMARLIGELDAEIVGAAGRRKEVLEAHAEAEVASRLQGKPLPPPKALATIDSEVEAKAATRNAAAAIVDAARAALPGIRKLLDEAEGRLQQANYWRAFVAWQEALGPLEPLAARLVAAQMAVGLATRESAVEVRPSNEAIAAARTAMTAEAQPVHIVPSTGASEKVA